MARPQIPDKRLRTVRQLHKRLKWLRQSLAGALAKRAGFRPSTVTREMHQERITTIEQRLADIKIFKAETLERKRWPKYPPVRKAPPLMRHKNFIPR